MNSIKHFPLALNILKTLTNNLPDMLWIKDVNGSYLYANETLCKNLLMAENVEEVVGKNDVFFAKREREKHPDNPKWHTFGELCFNSDEEVIKANKPMRFEEYGNVKGQLVYLEVHKAPFYDNKGKLLGTVGSGRDITDMVLMKKQLEDQRHDLDYQAHHDPLTNLPNRLLFQDRLENALNKSKRSGIKIALFFIDLDNFKHINDSYGHDRGDEILQIVTTRIRNIIRQTDTLSRLGGDEFTLILDDYWRFNDLPHLAEKILKELQKVIVIHNTNHYISASIGISINSKSSYNATTMLKHADSAMYRAKDNGKNTFEFYSDDLTNKAFQRVNLADELRIALKENQLRTFFQPKVNLTNLHITGAECLIRWQHPKLGLISPIHFIPIAEESDLIVSIDRWIFNDALQHLKQWQNILPENFILAINLSCRQLEQRDLIPFLKDQLSKHQINAQQVELEITETLMMENVQHSIQVLKDIKALGFKLAIDDFGTGYSSLAYLKKFNADTLKIDISFIKNLPFDKEDSAIVKAIIAMAESLSIKVVAEGVESEGQLRYLQQLHCQTGQGYLFNKPVTATDFQKRLLTPLYTNKNHPITI